MNYTRNDLPFFGEFTEGIGETESIKHVTF
jgi:hypothetical protein